MNTRQQRTAIIALEIFFVLSLVPTLLTAQWVDSLFLPGYTGLPVDGGGSWFVTHHDVDNDGDLDLFVGRSHETDEIYLNDGAGHFSRVRTTRPFQMGGGSHDALWLDLNQDSRKDLILARSPASGSSALLDGTNLIFLSNPNGTFTEAPNNLPPGSMIPLVGLTNSVNYSMGIASGDFNRDGKIDLVIANGGMNYLIQVAPLKPLDGQWILLPALRDAVLKNNLFIRSSEDLNNDGVLDFADSSLSSTVGAISDLSTDVVVADFNGDTLDDIFVTNFYNAGLALAHPGADNYISKLYLNDKNNPGHFIWMKEFFPSNLRPSTSVSAGDVDNDGDIDLFITNEARSAGSTPDERSRIYLNDNTGRFRDATDELLPELGDRFRSTYHGILVDVNGDDLLDIFGAGIHNFLLVQRPDGTFADSTSALPRHAGSGIPYTFHSYGATLADFNGDSRLDIVTVDTYEQNRLQIQTSSGQFIDSTEINLPPSGENTTSAAIGDLDGDGDMDIVAGNFAEVHGPSLHLNVGTSYVNYPLFHDGSDAIPNGPRHVRGVRIADINNDGRLDILFSGYDGGRMYYNAGNSSDGRPRFIDSTAQWLPEFATLDSTNQAVLFDLDRDGRLDLFLPNGRLESAGQPNRLFLWKDGKFTDATTWLPENNARTLQADFADVNNDGWADILAVNEDGPMALYLSTNLHPSATPGYRRVIPDAFVNNGSVSAKFGDVDSDTDIDIVEVSGCCLAGTDSLKYFYENLGTFSNGIPDFRAIPYGERDFQNRDVELVDMNSDGFLDVITAGRGAAKVYFYAPGSGRIAEFPNFWDIETIAGGALSIHDVVTGDVNQDGLTDVYLARDNQDLLYYGVGEPATSVNNTRSTNTLHAVHIQPNPFQEDAVIVCQITERSNVEITLFDLLGREIGTVFNGVREPGELRLPLSLTAIEVETAILFAHVQIGDETSVHQIIKSWK